MLKITSFLNKFSSNIGVETDVNDSRKGVYPPKEGKVRKVNFNTNLPAVCQRHSGRETKGTKRTVTKFEYNQ